MIDKIKTEIEIGKTIRDGFPKGHNLRLMALTKISILKECLKWAEEFEQKIVSDILLKVETNLLYPFEGTLTSGKELERPKILDMQRESFNKIEAQYKQIASGDKE